MNSDAFQDKKDRQVGNDPYIETLKVRANLVIQGLDMAAEVKRNMKTLIKLYMMNKKQPNKQRLHDIYRCI